MGKTLKNGDRGPEVKKLQTSLNDSGAKPKLKVDGQFGPATDAAVKEFQKQNKLKQNGVVSGEVTDALSEKAGRASAGSSAGGKGGAENIEAGADILSKVDSGLKKKVLAFAEEYGPITITSGKRTVAKQAELMAPMSDKDLGMYGKGPYVDEIKKLPKKERTTKKVEEILDKWIKKGSFVSRHLQGRAIDIHAKSGFDWNKAKQAAKKVGLTVKEEEGRDCFHVQL
jgi:peptidoglycan hydrolase-like protein with peptidoglycan-binding domain